jgi:ABC-2 type transport system ATP-binding protein
VTASPQKEKRESAIVATGLKKSFRVAKQPDGVWAGLASLFRRETSEVHAVAGVDIAIPAGACVGFLGPNGAGKTTTLKMLSGLLVPTSGHARLLGFTPWQRDPAFLRQISLVMGQKQQLIWDLPPNESFLLNRAIYGIDAAAYKRTLDDLVARLEIGAVMHRPTRQLSLGERMKCELACALLHRPKLLFLDEPTIGLDVAMQDTIRVFLKEYLADVGATIMLTSHYMADIVALCSDVIVIDSGTVHFSGSLRELVRRAAPKKEITLRLTELPNDNESLRSALAAMAGENSATLGDMDPLLIRFSVAEEHVADLLTRALALLATHDAQVRDVSVGEPPLEQVLKHAFGTAKG